MESSHAAGMHDGNKRGIQGIKHDGKTVCSQYTEGRIRQMRHQRVGFNVGNAVRAPLP